MRISSRTNLRTTGSLFLIQYGSMETDNTFWKINFLQTCCNQVDLDMDFRCTVFRFRVKSPLVICTEAAECVRPNWEKLNKQYESIIKKHFFA